MTDYVVIFNTKTQADLLQNRDYLDYLLTIKNPVVLAQTTSWDVPRQRLDGKWSYFTYPPADYTGQTVVEYNETDYYMEE